VSGGAGRLLHLTHAHSQRQFFCFRHLNDPTTNTPTLPSPPPFSSAGVQGKGTRRQPAARVPHHVGARGWRARRPARSAAHEEEYVTFPSLVVPFRAFLNGRFPSALPAPSSLHPHTLAFELAPMLVLSLLVVVLQQRLL
jgi:hypothetical protein